MRRLLVVSCVLWVLGCGSEAPPLTQPRSVQVYAAASLREATEELASAFEREHPELDLVLNFGASNVLAQQVLAAHQADVFLSADTLQMDAIADAGLVEARAPRPWLSNQLVVVVPAAAQPFELRSAADLAHERIRRLSLANPEAVPAGRYARAWLEKQGVWNALQARVVPGTDVRTALAAVESGACEAGIVYSTDAGISQRVRVALRIPLAEGPKIEYALGLLRGQASRADALAVFEHLQSLRAQECFASHGFLIGGQ